MRVSTLVSELLKMPRNKDGVFRTEELARSIFDLPHSPMAALEHIKDYTMRKRCDDFWLSD
jgi:hypothetical protein